MAESPGYPGRDRAHPKGEEHQQGVCQGGRGVVGLEYLLDAGQKKAKVFSEAAAEDIEHEGGEHEGPGYEVLSGHRQGHPLLEVGD